MEPKLSAPNRSPEHFSPQSSEYQSLPVTPERFSGQKLERVEQNAETHTSEASHAILPPPVVLQQPTSDSDDVSTLPTDESPMVAGDEDLIEREWVDKAKRIILETKDDPYKREQEVASLQADYIRKRYGKELGAPN